MHSYERFTPVYEENKSRTREGDIHELNRKSRDFSIHARISEKTKKMIEEAYKNREGDSYTQIVEDAVSILAQLVIDDKDECKQDTDIETETCHRNDESITNQQKLLKLKCVL